MCELMQFVQDNKDAGKDIGYRLPLGGADATMGDVGDEYAPGVGDGLDHGVDLNACWEVTVADAEPVPSTPTARPGGCSKHAAFTKDHITVGKSRFFPPSKVARSGPTRFFRLRHVCRPTCGLHTM